MEQGTVKWFNGDKGFGFLLLWKTAQTFSFTSQLSMPMVTLEEGQHVTLDVEQGDHGPQAANVTVVELPNNAEPIDYVGGFFNLSCDKLVDSR